MTKSNLLNILLILCATLFSQWSSLADFPGTARRGAVGFAIGDKGYIGMGYDINDNYYKDLWEYDPVSNSWEQKSYLGGDARYGAVGFSISGKGYVGTGLSGDFPYTFHNDFWEFDPVANSWTQLDDFGGAGMFEAVGLSDGTFGYVVTGQAREGYTKELWEFLVETGIDYTSGKDEESFSVYPNPSMWKLSFKMTDDKDAEISIFNTNGQLIKKIDFKKAPSTFEVNGLVKGTYFIRYKNDKGVQSSKFIKL
ncbi:MAG: T9SS type A sorting domain-containing protein [Candidatus Delongbacteria bacterium]|nr:T9SS type A sorting domain-containing protein [Candidatus Delongbacteria bacterium]MCG2760349.1 T9SS type A sorting domain-containing protein [Candidatus Delongbacteria bacterium]